jgi:hypothetical protein
MSNITYTIGDGLGYSINLSPEPAKLMSIQWEPSMQITLHGEENNQVVKLQLTPESDMTPKESLLMNVLFASLMGASNKPSNAALMKFIRAHNLERHFRMSV